MSDLLTTAIAMQRRLIDAQQAQVDAAQALLGLGAQTVTMQETARRATEANVRAMKAWAELWGW